MPKLMTLHISIDTVPYPFKGFSYNTANNDERIFKV